MPYCVVLGARDPERERAKKVLDAAGIKWVVARQRDRREVKPSTCYQAAWPKARKTLYIGGRRYRPLWFEAAPADGGKARLNYLGVTWFDHHEPGDPGYDLPYTEFARAAALAQMMAFLGIPLTYDDLVICAADHAPAKAYLELCSATLSDGKTYTVRADDVKAAQARATAERAGVGLPVVWRSIGSQQRWLRSAPRMTYGALTAVYRERAFKAFYEFLCLREACLMISQPYIVWIRIDHECEDGTTRPALKLMINGGNVPVEFISEFRSGNYFPGVEFRFGCEARGYCGGIMLLAD